MENKKPNYLIYIALVVGVIFLFKWMGNHPSHNEKANISFSAAQLNDIDLKPFHQKVTNSQPQSKTQKFKRSLRKRNYKKTSFNMPRTESHTFNKGKKGKKGRKIAKKDKKKDKKKKKDEKKKKDVADKFKNAEDALEYQADNLADNQNDTVNTDTEVAAGNNPVVTSNNNNPEQSLDEWVDFVLNKPSLNKTTKLIRYYQSSLISAATFYLVVEEMIKDNRPLVNEMAIVALSSTPSYHSFMTLTSLIEAEAHGSTLRVRAEQSLRNYKEISQLKTLQTVLLNSDSSQFSVYQAALILVSSVSTYLSDEAKSEDPDAEAHPNFKYYESFLPALESIISTNTVTPEVKGYAESSYDRIKELQGQITVSSYEYHQ